MSTPENRGAHAHDGRPFLDGHVEIAAHPHRQLAEHRRGHSRRQPSVAQLAEPPEPRSRIFRRIRRRRQRHQADDPRRLAGGCGLEEPRNLRGRHAVLRRFARQIDLDQQFRRVSSVGRPAIELFEQLHAVDRLNHRERRRRLARLVRLQVAEEMPPD
jgi:hypothetical protein